MSFFDSKNSNCMIQNEYVTRLINRTVLFAYFVLNMLSFLRYFYTFSSYGTGFLAVAIVSLSMKILIFLAAIYKIVYFFKNYEYSIFAIFSIVGLLTAFLFKNHYGIKGFLMDSPQLFTILIILVAIKGISFDNICKIYLYSIGVLFLIRTFLAIGGIFPGEIISNTYGEVCNDLGYGNHNAGMVMFMFICLSFLYVERQSRKRYYYVAVIVIATIGLYILTKSKTSSVIILMFCVLYTFLFMLNKNENKKNNAFSNIFFGALKWSPIVSLIITICGTVLHNICFSCVPNYKDVYVKYTPLSRFAMISEDFALNGIHIPFFSQTEEKSEIAFNYLLGAKSQTPYHDNFYHILFIEFGIVIFFIVVLLLQLTALYTYKYNFSVLLLIVSMLSLFNIMESHGMYYAFSPFVFLPIIIFDNDNTVNRES